MPMTKWKVFTVQIRKLGFREARGTFRGPRRISGRHVLHTKLLCVQKESRDLKANTPTPQPCPTCPGSLRCVCGRALVPFLHPACGFTSNEVEEVTSPPSQRCHSPVPSLQGDLSTSSRSHYRPMTIITGEEKSYFLCTINLMNDMTLSRLSLISNFSLSEIGQKSQARK